MVDCLKTKAVIRQEDAPSSPSRLGVCLPVAFLILRRPATSFFLTSRSLILIITPTLPSAYSNPAFIPCQSLYSIPTVLLLLSHYISSLHYRSTRDLSAFPTALRQTTLQNTPGDCLPANFVLVSSVNPRILPTLRLTEQQSLIATLLGGRVALYHIFLQSDNCSPTALTLVFPAMDC